MLEQTKLSSKITKSVVKPTFRGKSLPRFIHLLIFRYFYIFFNIFLICKQESCVICCSCRLLFKCVFVLCASAKDKFPVEVSLMDEACCLNVMSPRICGQSEIIPLPLVCQGPWFFTFKYFYVSLQINLIYSWFNKY